MKGDKMTAEGTQKCREMWTEGVEEDAMENGRSVWCEKGVGWNSVERNMMSVLSD